MADCKNNTQTDNVTNVLIVEKTHEIHSKYNNSRLNTHTHTRTRTRTYASFKSHQLNIKAGLAKTPYSLHDTANVMVNTYIC